MVPFTWKEHYDLNDFRQVIAILRHPGGCPWDQAQDHHSIRRNFIEEVYEACEGIDTENTELLREELGDVLMQVLFHASIEEDAGRFDIDDVADQAVKKLIFRHPHVFGAVDAPDTDKALSAWEAQKREEKGQKTAADTLDAVARSLPALTRAEKIQEKAWKAGFDWDAVGPVLDKIAEEAAELRQAVRDNTNIEEELGDLLFVTVKAGRFLGLDSELALHAACEKFIRRFRRVEELADKPMTQLDVPALEALWRQAKAMEHQAT